MLVCKKPVTLLDPNAWQPWCNQASKQANESAAKKITTEEVLMQIMNCGQYKKLRENSILRSI